MKIKLILPALTEAKSPFFRPIKYSLFPPLGLATLAAYLPTDWDIEIVDEHVETLDWDDRPDLVVIQVYITNAYRSYEIADHYRSKGAYVCLGGLHVTALPDESALHANSIFLGPGEDIWPAFIEDWRNHNLNKIYRSTNRSLLKMPAPRRDLIKRHLYLVPNSIVVSRGCPHHCDFCYKDGFFTGGKSFYTQKVDASLGEIETLPGKHLYFLDDNLFGDPKFAANLFNGLIGMNRLWQAAGTVKAVLRPNLMEQAAAAGLKSLFIGFETLNPSNLKNQNKIQNLNRDYSAAIQKLHDLGIMINASFVFGMDDDENTVFERTVDWAVQQGIQTATFHILTPYPGTVLHKRMESEGRIFHRNWDLYDTRHTVFQPKRMSPEQLEQGYWRAYNDFYRWNSIFLGAKSHQTLFQQIQHLAYAGGWKKFESLWDWVIRLQKVGNFRTVLETVLSGNPARAQSSSHNLDFLENDLGV